jgi:palmitoyl-protein thioesterase
LAGFPFGVQQQGCNKNVSSNQIKNLSLQKINKNTKMARLTTLLTLLATATLISSLSLPTPQSTRHGDDDDDTPLPLVIWHGLGDNYAAEGLASVAQLAEETNPGTFVYIVRLDENPSADRSATFLGNLTVQLEKVCADLAAHPILSTAPAVDAIGFSQGGQFLRGYIERCNFPQVRSLVTFGSQHNGISQFQDCASSDWLCKGSEALLRSNTWSSFVQNRLIPAQYFRDPAQYDQYIESSNFLADVNNERILKNQTYKENMEKLERLVMYMFEDDKTVVPKESSWFAEVIDGKVTELKDRAIYKEDWIGLKALDKKGALEFRTTPGGHMSLTDTLLEKVFKDYFGPYGKSFAKVDETRFQEEL